MIRRRFAISPLTPSRPRHIHHFRGRFLDQIKVLFVQVLEIAAAMKLLHLGTISLESTKIKANAEPPQRRKATSPRGPHPKPPVCARTVDATERDDQKIVLQGKLSDLSCISFTLGPAASLCLRQKHPWSAVQQLRLPLRDLVDVHRVPSARSARVLSPLTAANATLALNAALWFLPAFSSPLLVSGNPFAHESQSLHLSASPEFAAPLLTFLLFNPFIDGFASQNSSASCCH